MKINVYGTGINAVKFVLENRDIEINSFIEGKVLRTEFMPKLFGDKSVVMLEDAYKTLKTYFTVVASAPNVYWEIKNRLEKEYGLIEFEDFCYYEIFRKKIAIIYGNCHTTPIHEALRLSRGFVQEYGFYPINPICTIEEQGGIAGFSKVFEKCDLFIHQCIWEKNVYGTEYSSFAILKFLKRTCKIIGIPNVYRMPRFLFPQMKSEGDEIVWEGYMYFPFRDYYIDRNYKTLNIRELVDLVRDDTLIDSSDIIEGRNTFFEKVAFREKEWDIKISSFLHENLKYKQLFYDPNHPTNQIIVYIVKEILKILRIDGSYLDFENNRKLDNFEIPIYASVYKALKLEYRVNNLRVYSKYSINNTQIDLEEYIRQYIIWNYPSK